MKKYLSIILLIGIIIVGTLVYNAVKVDKEVSKYFSESGYILQSKAQDAANQTIERYYFKEETKYKQKYNETVSFNNSEGENIIANTENFIHYSNGAISSFKNGVILNLEDIDKTPIYYYNIKAGNILKKQNNTYVINNLEKELKFESLIWKISSQKYIILSNNIILKFDDGTTNQINGYLELEYTDNEVVKIYNQEVTYKTISSEVSISFPDNIILNVSSKTISKDDENKMNLENMVIDSDDNVTIVDLTEEKNKKDDKTTENDEEDKNENNSSNNNQNSNVSNNQGNANGGIISGNQNQVDTSYPNDNSNSNNINSGNDSNINNGTSDSNEDDFKETVTIKKEPKYKIEEFEVNPLGVRTSITIKDEENLLTGKSTVKILKNKTGKTVYETESELGEYNIYLEVLSLDSDTEYTLVVSSSYDIDGITYNKDFISKIFRTTKLGISLKKEVFTDTSMEFSIKVEKDSNIKNFEVVIKDENDEIIETKTVECSTSNEKNSVEFTELTPNKKYNVSIKNVLYNSQIITDGFELEENFITLKSKPILTGTEFEINKRESKFVLRVRNVKDVDNAIQKYQFQIYDTRTAETDEDGNIDFNATEPIAVIDSKTKETTLNIDDEKIFRNVGYTFKLVAIGYDNEKECEYESEYSNVFKMDGDQFPTIRFEETKITFERIQGKIVVDDPGETIHLTNDTVFKITYKDSSGTIKSFTSQGSYVIPVDVNNLRANETYQFSVYTTIDLNDGNPVIDECFIGGILLKTSIPQNMVANFVNNKTDAKSAFKISMQLKNEKSNQESLEAETLTGIVFSIYSGQAIDGELPSKAPLRTIKMIDSNMAPYESELKEKYFDNSVELTPEFFGAQNKDFKNQYYTITITNAYDYTDYRNNLPILNNIYVIRTNGYMPDLPTDPNNAVVVTTVRNRDNTEVRSDLNAETVVGYKTKAEYNNSDLCAKKVIYKAYDAKTNLLIKTIILDVGSDGIIPTAFFEVFDGTEDDVIDSDA